MPVISETTLSARNPAVWGQFLGFDEVLRDLPLFYMALKGFKMTLKNSIM